MPGSDCTRITDPLDGYPREVGGYRLLRRLGEGGMSAVFLSYDVAAGHPVAVKLLADHLTHSREFVTRFYREARLSRLLSHPNLVQGLGAGFDPAAGKHYLVLEFVDGPTAHSALAAGPFPVGAAVKVGIDIAAALQFLHSREYVHRDVKPDNVLLHPDGSAKLADLGLTKRLNDDPRLTAQTQGVGTSYYMAYEQGLNAHLVDGRTDIFSLGATLYHLLTGEVPFPGTTHEEVMRGKEHATFRPARDRNPRVPPELDAVIARTLARDPRLRFQSAEELAAALSATGLATPIPRFGIGEGAEPQGAGSPTRPDLPTLACLHETPPRELAAAAPVAAAGALTARRKPALGGSQVGFLLVALAAGVSIAGLTLGAVARARRMPTAPPVPHMKPLPPPPGADSLPPPVPQ